MTILRRHIWAIVVYLFGFAVLAMWGTLFLLYAHPPETLFWAILALLMPVSCLAPLVVILPFFYVEADIDRKAEWSVLAPALMAGLTIGTNFYSVTLLVRWLPPGPAPASYFVIRALINMAFTLAIAVLCAGLVARFMSRPKPDCPRAAWGTHILAVLAMVTSVSLATTAARMLADFMHWGIGATFEEANQTNYLRMALTEGVAILAITVTWIVLAHAFLRKTDELSRWSAMAAIAAWVPISAWISTFQAFCPWPRESRYAPLFEGEPHGEVEWFVGLFLTKVFWGAVAGGLAILYARLVTYRLGLKKLTHGRSGTVAQQGLRDGR